jgi:predicted NBD/HSP70 family sugar kinase/DNA-binding transcriptional ArsR family regulator
MRHLAGSSKLLRAMNESAMLGLLLERGPLTRGELRELTGLSKPTISDLLRRLTAAGLAVQVGQTSGGPGPNAEIYAANATAAYAAAISVRETPDTSRAVLSAALCDVTGRVVATSEKTVEFGPDTAPVEAVAAAINHLRRSARISRGQVQHVEIGLPGSYDPAAHTIRHIHVAGWGRPGLIDDLARRLDTTVMVENDVNLAAIAERSRGVAGDCDSFALIWFGEGLGLAVDLSGVLIRGARGGAGEIGYIPVGLDQRPGPTELQDLLGEAAVLALAAQHGLTGASTAAEALATAADHITRSTTTAADTTSADGTAAEAAGGPAAFLDALAARIAWALAAVAAILDPALIVLGGDLARAAGPMLADRVSAALGATSPLEATIAVTGVAGDPVLLGALDSALRVVRTTLIDNLRSAVPAA